MLKNKIRIHLSWTQPESQTGASFKEEGKKEKKLYIDRPPTAEIFRFHALGTDRVQQFYLQP